MATLCEVTPQRNTYAHFRRAFLATGIFGVLCFLYRFNVRSADLTPDLFYKHNPQPRTRHLPHAIVIGARKAGTRALLKFLRLHPDIEFKSKEVHFFNTEFYDRGLEFYKKKMPLSRPNQLTLEKTPNYFTSAIVPERIVSMNHSIRLILIVREPVTRLVSDYVDGKTKAYRKGQTQYPSIESLVMTDDGQVDCKCMPISVSTYHTHFSKWLKWFPRKQIHIVDGESFIASPAEELAKLETFLGIEHRLTKGTFNYNETKGFYCVKEFGKGAHRHKCLSGSKGRKHPTISPGLRRKLKDYFKHPNELFYEMANMRFNW